MQDRGAPNLHRSIHKLKVSCFFHALKLLNSHARRGCISALEPCGCSSKTRKPLQRARQITKTVLQHARLPKATEGYP